MSGRNTRQNEPRQGQNESRRGQNSRQGQNEPRRGRGQNERRGEARDQQPLDFARDRDYQPPRNERVDRERDDRDRDHDRRDDQGDDRGFGGRGRDDRRDDRDYDRRDDRREDRHDDRREDDRVPVLRVAGGSDAKSMSTAVERRIADHRAVQLEAVGANSVNQAAKSIAIARTNLQNSGRTAAVFLDFIRIAPREGEVPAPGQEGGRSALQFHVFSAPPHWIDRYDDRYGDDSRVLRVSQKQEAKAVATTIVNRMRNGGSMKLQAVGAGSVNTTAKAIAISRRTMEDTMGMEVACFPEFVHVPAPSTPEGGEAGREHSALRWTLFQTNRGPPRGPPRNEGGFRGESRGEPRGEPRGGERRGPPRQAAVAPPTRIPFQGDKEGTPEELKVAGTSTPQAVAGAVATRLRGGDSVRLTVMGPASVNQAVKALAVARTYLAEDRVDFSVYAGFIHIPSTNPDEADRSAIQLTAFPCSPHQFPEGENVSEYKVAGGTNPKSTAGAIANCIRDKKHCKLEALGRDAVNQAIKAISIGRANLEADKVDILFVPQFQTLHLSNGRRSALELLIVTSHP